MSGAFIASAIPRLDGSDADGVHLMWTAPPAAGYSVDGWDIQRRRATGKPDIDCRALTQAELDLLHASLRLRLPIGVISVREAACPELPTLPPDGPEGDSEPPRRTCVRLSRLKPGHRPNPRKQGRLTIEVRDASGALTPRTTVAEMAGHRGLHCGFETVVDLSVPATAVELTLVHLSTPAQVEAFHVDGTSAGRVRMSVPQGQRETLRLTGAALGRVVVRAPADETLLLELCVEVRAGAGALAALPVARRGLQVGPSVAPAALAATHGEGRCLAYEIALMRGHRFVEVRAGIPPALVIALREGKAVDARVLSGAGAKVARVEERDVDQVMLYTSAVASSLEICLDQPVDPADEEADWANEPFIAKGIQVPVRALEPGLASAADEEVLASSRLLASEAFDTAVFRDVADVMNTAAADADEVSPAWSSRLVRSAAADPFVELRPWPYALALLIDGAWRRLLGFGFLDPVAGLTPGDVYDYRIIGRFRRRDLEETLHGFHTVPRGTTLPVTFALGSVELRTPAPATVELRPAVAGSPLTAAGRKGIALSGDPCLVLRFPTPVTRVVLEVEAGSSLRWAASTTDLLPGLPINNLGGNLPADRRLTIEPADPVDVIELRGTGILFGVREVGSPAGTKPDDVLTRSVVLHGIVMQDSPAPPPPPFLGTLNLQEPTVPAAPGTTPVAPASLGFRLSWLPPPPAGGGGLVPWPADLGAFPPFDVLAFQLERRRVDTGGAFEEIDGPGVTTLVFGSRSGRRDPPPLRPGIDLEQAFPERTAPTPPIPVFMSLDDVLVPPGKAGPPPGSTHQYRIWSVDAIGRRSASNRVGSVVRLEKRQPPPKPVGRPGAPAGGAIAPSGVRARALVAADLDLTATDRALLGASQNAVVLEWGWTQAERDADPYATAFRVYWQPLPPDVVRGRLTGAATLAGGAYEIAAAMDRTVTADAMRGRYIVAPDYPFKIGSHTAGQSIAIRLEPSALAASRVPGAADFEFRPVLTGAEGRPSAWAERTGVVPITAAEGYQHVFRDRLTLDATHPRARVWAGVSAADDQAYVADQLPASATNGGLPGNESAIVAAPAFARYIGRPTFTVPPPLPDVPEAVTDEPAGATVAVRVDLPALLSSVTIPTGHRVLLERMGLHAIVARISARADDTIGAILPDGTTSSYTLANAGDHAAFLAQIRTGTAGRVEGRFLMDVLLHFPNAVEPLWQLALPEPVAFGALADMLPGKAERYVHRIRLVDAAGHVSAGAAIVPRIVRVPSLRSPGPPRLAAPSTTTDEIDVEARVRDVFDVSWLLLFSLVADAAAPPNGELSAPAQLLRLPNRRDLYPNAGLRLRLADGTLLSPATVVAASGGTVEVPDRVLTATLTPGYDRRISLWAVAVTRDGVPSRFAGPLVALTGPRPLGVPALTVASAAGGETAQWSAPSVPAELALQRSLDGGTTWRQVSPWLSEGTTRYVVPSAAGTVRYRAILRADRGRTATGPTVTPS